MKFPAKREELLKIYNLFTLLLLFFTGSYRPSYEEMLRFYSYYKQATVGPCQISRPGFWDPIGRYKW